MRAAPRPALARPARRPVARPRAARSSRPSRPPRRRPHPPRRRQLAPVVLTVAEAPGRDDAGLVPRDAGAVGVSVEAPTPCDIAAVALAAGGCNPRRKSRAAA